jgi:hypothetical protein
VFSLEECKEVCTENSECLSFDIQSGPASELTCYTGLVTYDMMNSVDPTEIRDDNDYDLYSKTCSWLLRIDIEKKWNLKKRYLKNEMNFLWFEIKLNVKQIPCI